MVFVKTCIWKITDCSYPMFVECYFKDCHGATHYFRDKLPIFSLETDVIVPCAGILRCTIVSETQDTIWIDTSQPDDVSSTNDTYRFEVFRSQIIDASGVNLTDFL